jgi:hypothetical protein
MMKGSPTLRIHYVPGELPKVTNVEDDTEIYGINAVRVELLPAEVRAEIDVIAEVYVETSNINVTSEEFEALKRLAIYLDSHLRIASPEVVADLNAVDRLLYPIGKGGMAAHAATS